MIFQACRIKVGVIEAVGAYAVNSGVVVWRLLATDWEKRPTPPSQTVIYIPKYTAIYWIGRQHRRTRFAARN